MIRGAALYGKGDYVACLLLTLLLCLLLYIAHQYRGIPARVVFNGRNKLVFGLLACKGSHAFQLRHPLFGQLLRRSKLLRQLLLPARAVILPGIQSIEFFLQLLFPCNKSFLVFRNLCPSFLALSVALAPETMDLVLCLGYAFL